MPQRDPRAETQADRRRRHRRLGARSGREQGRDPRRDRLAAGGGNLRPQHPEGECRGRSSHSTTRFIVLSREKKWAAHGNGKVDHHLRVPGAQRAGRALQGDGRLRHQRRQHDQARELHGRRQFLRHAVLCRRRRPSRRSRAGVCARGARLLLQGADHPRRLSRARLPRDVQGRRNSGRPECCGLLFRFR